MPILAISDKPLGEGSLLETRHSVSDNGYRYITQEFKRFYKLQEFLMQLKLIQPVSPDQLNPNHNFKRTKEEEKQDD